MATRTIRTFYDELGVGRDARPSEIKRAFRDIAKVYHPDRNPSEKKEWAHERMSRINFILETLLDTDSRAEYDSLVAKAERGLLDRPRRTARQEYALEQEYARVSVEIMNLSGKYSNCRIKMVIGGCVCAFSLVGLLILSFLNLGAFVANFYMSFARFLALVGMIIAGMGVSDYVGRGHYRKRIHELENRQSTLRRRMYEAWTG